MVSLLQILHTCNSYSIEKFCCSLNRVWLSGTPWTLHTGLLCPSPSPGVCSCPLSHCFLNTHINVQIIPLQSCQTAGSDSRAEIQPWNSPPTKFRCCWFKDHTLRTKTKNVGFWKLGGFPGAPSGKESTCPYRSRKRCRFHPWVGKIPWRKAW